MAIRIPIITDFQGDGLKKTFEQFKALETNAEKASFALKKSFVPALAAIGGLTAGLVMSSKGSCRRSGCTGTTCAPTSSNHWSNNSTSQSQ
jgi:hypothetical protein